MNLLFDIGGTRMRFGLCDKDPDIKNVKIYPTPKKYSDALNFLNEKLPEITNGAVIDKIEGGIAGTIVSNKLHNSPNLLDWVLRPIKDDLLKIFRASECELSNDASLAALGEAVYGAGKDYNSIAYITIGTGVGGARVVNRKIDSALYGFEPGHQIVDISNIEEPITIENLISGSAIERKKGIRAGQIDDPEFWDRIERYLVVGLVNTIVYWTPEVIILGGGIVNSGKFNIENIKRQLEKQLQIYPKIPEIKQSELGQEGGLYGALYKLQSK